MLSRIIAPIPEEDRVHEPVPIVESGSSKGSHHLNPLQLSDVQSTNLHMLCAIHSGVERDRVVTCSKFALDQALASYIRAMNDQLLWSTVAHFGEITMFPPRQDLLALLQAPPPLTGPLALVRAPRPRPAT